MLEIHTFPQGQQLSEGEIVQIRKIQSGRYIFRDCYFNELQEGDQYIIPEQVELPMATDTEVLDFILDNDVGITHTLSSTRGWVAIWNRETSKDITDRSFDPEKTDLRSVFREMVSETIANNNL